MDKVIYEREDVLNIICSASWGNNLGFFVGSGFSKSANASFPDWKRLLELIIEHYQIEEKLFENGDPYPIIATKIFNIVFENYNLGKNMVVGDELNTQYPTQNDIILAIKKYIAKIVDLEPDISIKEKYSQFFDEINPNWIITTNYDNILEKVVGGRAFTILPERPYFKNKYILPIYHIHGSIIEPKSIIISNEDYAETLRPYDYRHIRLPIFMKESTVVMMGYALNDLNVLSAVDYKNNVYKGNLPIDNSIILLKYSKGKKDKECYLDSNTNIIVCEIEDIESFFLELILKLKNYKSVITTKSNKISEKNTQFINTTDTFVEKFISNEGNYRTETIKLISSTDVTFNYIYSSFNIFIEKVFDYLYTFAVNGNQGFKYYADILGIIIDLSSGLKENQQPRSFVDLLIKAFDDVSIYVGYDLGQAYKAQDLWNQRKKEMNKFFIDSIYRAIDNGEVRHIRNVQGLLKDIL